MERQIIYHTRSLSHRLIQSSTRRPASVASSCSTASQRSCTASLRPASRRSLHTTAPVLMQSKPPKSRDRGPKSDEDTQTDFGALDVLRNTAAPATSIDATTSDGFALNNQMRVSGCGLLLVGGEAFRWRPWLREGRKEGTVAEDGLGEDQMTGRLSNRKGQWEVQEGSWGVLELVWPKPDILIIGTGPHVLPLAPAVRTYLNGLGIRLEVQDTRNAAAQFNLLATERGVGQVAAALIPTGWREGSGIVSSD
ncbi:hypothetical protein BU25DRAFT_376427 [Macroventuria anomochaeta]|uniref:Uncharacterized protein n=1 Tax=Macroventuria anomochaeta TaxID=301207 RepID=A0ACB6RMS0_9PLEO|nr:uncharacterized protein BU25DRAFT_376427 [Macroventuria anomochaeta]KAF2623103.1 hypothetical protein BU25DRAFT_376427 [Macroventuria anomochaeta]